MQTVHNPDRYMIDLRQIMSQGRKRIGLFIGAGAPTSIRVDGSGKISPAGSALIPDVAGLTDHVLQKLDAADFAIVDGIRSKLVAGGNIEAILTQVRRLAQALGTEKVRGLDGNDYVQHLATEDHLRRIYNTKGQGHVTVGTLASAESISAKIALNELITRHSAVLGSTGSGKSTTVASLLRSITAPQGSDPQYPSARVLMLDIHGEYSAALADVAQVFRAGANGGAIESELQADRSANCISSGALHRRCTRSAG